MKQYNYAHQVFADLDLSETFMFQKGDDLADSSDCTECSIVGACVIAYKGIAFLEAIERLRTYAKSKLAPDMDVDWAEMYEFIDEMDEVLDKWFYFNIDNREQAITLLKELGL